MIVKDWWNYKEGEDQYKKKILAFFCGTIFLFICFVGSIFYASGQGSRMTITEQEISKEKNFVNQYKRDESTWNEENRNFSRPITKNEIDSVQNDLLQKTKNYQLNITMINTIATAPAPVNGAQKEQAEANKGNNAAGGQVQTVKLDGIEYEISFYGTWESTVRYIRDMQRSPGLLAIRSVSMKPKQNLSQVVETTLKYKIYIQ